MKSFLLKVLLLCGIVQIAQAQALQFAVIDGKTNNTILMAAASETAKTADAIKIQQILNTSTAPQQWRVAISNTGKTPRYLYLRWRVEWNGAGNEALRYWPGTGEPVAGQLLQHSPASNANADTSMIQAIYNADDGLALALDPLEIISQFDQKLEYADEKYYLQLQIPLVLDGGQSDAIPVEIYRFTPRYGFLDALQKYFYAHPDAFTSRTNIDPNAAGVGAAYTAWNGFSFERTRRFGGDWDWCYAPFKRTGDIYGRPQFWNYNPARPIPDWEAKMTPEAFRENRQSKFQRGNAAGAAMMFYVPAFIYSEENLAKEQYPGAIVYKPDGKYAVYFDRPWVTGHDNEVMVYPWENKFSVQSQQDARDVVKENPISGFAYDVLNGGYKFRGTGMQQSPRRAFDDDGEYVDLSVGVAKMMDFTRSLEKDGRKMALVGNPTGNTRAFLVARCDSAMYERPPYKSLKELIPLRYAMGHKPLTWWDDWGISTMINWREMSPQEIQDAYRGVADYVRLASYRYGGYPSPRLVEGVPAIAHELPLLKKVLLQGWQPVPAVRPQSGVFPDYIWPARYGRESQTYITLGNASQAEWKGQILIDNEYLGTANYLFVDTAGNELHQSINGRTTSLDVRIAPHQTLVLRAVAQASRFAQGGAVASWKDDGAKGQLVIKSTFTVSDTTAPQPDWQETGHDANTWNFESRYLASSAADIENFPYFGAGKNALIVLPSNPSEQEKQVAHLLEQYFAFWGKNAMQPAQQITFSTIEGLAPVDATQPRIYISESLRKIQAKGNVLQIGAVADTSLSDVMLHLLGVLDQKYFYCGTFPRGGEQNGEAEMIQKSGLAGKLLQ